MSFNAKLRNWSVAARDRWPLPSPVSELTGAMQPFNSFNAWFAGCNRMSARPGTSFRTKCVLCFWLYRTSNRYLPSGMQERWDSLLSHGSSML